MLAFCIKTDVKNVARITYLMVDVDLKVEVLVFVMRAVDVDFTVEVLVFVTVAVDVAFTVEVLLIVRVDVDVV
jgi:hypothetical protein